jgi:hypothetical protein
MQIHICPSPWERLRVASPKILDLTLLVKPFSALTDSSRMSL